MKNNVLIAGQGSTNFDLLINKLKKSDYRVTSINLNEFTPDFFKNSSFDIVIYDFSTKSIPSKLKQGLLDGTFLGSAATFCLLPVAPVKLLNVKKNLLSL